MRSQAGKLKALENKVAEGDVDAVHDYRVALRRLRLALRLAGGGQAERLRKRAKVLADAVGEVRDLDVLMARPSIPNAWMLALRLERAEALKSALLRLEDAKHREWSRKIDRWIEEEASREGDEESFSATVQNLARDVVERSSAESEVARHRLRIAIKRLRYLLEFFKKVLPAETTHDLETLADAQDEIGSDRDLDLALARLECAAELSKDLGFVEEFQAAKAAWTVSNRSQVRGAAKAKEVAEAWLHGLRN